jgi:putative tricarboxylic transport membrane protein
VSDRIFGAVCLVLSLAFIWGATQIETGLIVDPLGPQSFPVLIGIVLAIASLYPLVKPDPRPDWPALDRVIEIVFAVAAMIAYAHLLEPLGFVIATALASFVLSWRLGARLMHAAGAGVGISLGIYAVFHLILGLSLARGPLGF